MFTDEELEKIENKRKEWEEQILNKFTERGERKDNYESPSGILCSSRREVQGLPTGGAGRDHAHPADSRRYAGEPL